MNLYSILMSDDVILEINNSLEYILNILEYDKDFIQEVCYLVKNHDYPIRERKVKENPSLLKKDLKYKDVMRLHIIQKS